MIVAVVGDVVPGICVCVVPPVTPFPATGVVITGNAQFTTGGIPVAVAGVSMVMFPCGTSVIVPNNFSFNLAGSPVATLGATVAGCGNGTLTATSQMTSL